MFNLCKLCQLYRLYTGCFFVNVGQLHLSPDLCRYVISSRCRVAEVGRLSAVANNALNSTKNVVFVLSFVRLSLEERMLSFI